MSMSEKGITVELGNGFPSEKIIEDSEKMPLWAFLEYHKSHPLYHQQGGYWISLGCLSCKRIYFYDNVGTGDNDLQRMYYRSNVKTCSR